MKISRANRAPQISAAKEWWVHIEGAIAQIHLQQASKCSFQLLHQAVFRMIQNGFGELLFKNLDSWFKKHLAERTLYVLKAKEGGFLKAIADEWQTQEMSALLVSQLLMYFDRNYCTPNGKPVSKELMHNIFGDCILKDPVLAERIQSSVLGCIACDRGGEVSPEIDYVKIVTRMCLSIDRHSFENLLERSLLEQLRTACGSDAKESFRMFRSPQFLERMFLKLSEERSRVQKFLDESMMPKVESIFRDNYITPFESAILDGLSGRSLLHEWTGEELSVLYRAFSFHHSVPVLGATVRNLLVEEGKRMLAEVESRDPVRSVEELIDLHYRIQEISTTSFAKHEIPDKRIATEVRKAFDEITNSNEGIAEMLAVFLDAKLKSSVDDTKLERTCEDVITIFRHVEEKDMFENSFKHYLARRLLSHKPVEEERERIFLQKLKKECGAGVSSKIEGMFADKRNSHEMNSNFAGWLSLCDVSLPHELSVLVLTSGFWPPTQKLSPTVSPSLERCIHVFRQFYLSRHNGRKLDFVFSQGTVDVRVTHNKKYDVTLPIASLPLLLLMEGDRSWTVDECASKVGLSVPDSAKSLASLVRGGSTHTGLLKVLNSSSNNTLSSSSIVTFNTDFKSKFVRLRIAPISILKEREQTSREVRTRVDEDRKFTIDAAVVRIMKSRRSLEHRDLVVQVQNVLKSTFAPSNDEIKKRIQVLIEREFIERSRESHCVYHYLA